MSQINYENARQLSKIWKAEGIKPLKIRQRLIEQGFASSEIQEIMGADYPARAVQKKKDGTYRFEEDKELEKGGCLTIWLALTALASVFLIGYFTMVLFSILTGDSLLYYSFFSIVFLVPIIYGSFQLWATIAVWNGRRWGYRFFIIIFSVGLFASVLSFDVMQVATSFLALFIFHVLANKHTK